MVNMSRIVYRGSAHIVMNGWIDADDRSQPHTCCYQGSTCQNLSSVLIFGGVLIVNTTKTWGVMLLPSPLNQHSMAQLQRKKEKGGRKRGTVLSRRADGQRKEEKAQTLWGMLYADDAGTVSLSPEGLRR